MTNREKTIQRIENQKEKNMKDEKQYGRISLFDRLELEYLEDIERDLEVLDILKKYIRAGQWSNEYTLLSWEMKSKELTKIKKWLEEKQ